MASNSEPWSLGDLFRNCMPWTRGRTISNGSSDTPETPTQRSAHPLVDTPSTAILMTNLVVPPPDNADNNSVPGTVAWQLLTQALRGLESSLDVFPPLKSAIVGLVACVERVQLAQRNLEEYQKLASDLATLAGSLQTHLPDGGPTRMPYSISNVARAINEQTSYIKQKQERHASVGLITAREDNEELLGCYRRVESLFRQLQMDISLSTWTLAHKQWVDTQLKGLAPAHDAFYNSTLAETMQRRGCTENTRKEVLDGMQVWVQDPNAPNIYWMNGMAGTGKTTIAYSICDQLETNDRLGASFFCSRNSASCQDVNRIVPTIAYQLSHYSNPYQTELCRMLDKELDVARRKIDVQFKKLVLEPLRRVKDALPQDVVIVIDALDECADNNGMRLVLDLIFQHAADLPVKLFITSRPEPVISDRIMRHDSPSRSILHLHDIEKSLVQADIQAYLTEALAPIHPDAKDIERLATRAGCLFIFAATVVRYISPSNPVLDHDDRLSTMLRATSTADQGDYKEVDDVYSTILQKALKDDVLNVNEREMRRRALWTVICAREPLDASTLSKILNIEDKRKLEIALEAFRSVLHVSGSNGLISALHASFPDFLLSAKRSGDFLCDKAKHDRYLASQSFNVMEKQLRFNICELQSSYLLDSEVLDLHTRVDQAISSELSYACRYWGDHLIYAKMTTDITSSLEEFLKHCFLFWVEVLNLKGWTNHGDNILTQILIWLPKIDDLAGIHQFVYDARNFATMFATNKVSLSTPHIYISALPFTSKESLVWSHYWPLTHGLVRVEGTMMMSRGKAAIASWETGSRVNCMALSPDGQKIVSGLFDKTVAIWDVAKGTRVIDPLRAHQGKVWSVAVSPDGARVASGSGSPDSTVIIWSTGTGGILAGPLHGHTNIVAGLAFSPSGSSLVSASEDHTMRMWDGHTGTWLGKSFEGHEEAVMSVVFSPDGKRIASGSDDRTIRIWDPDTCATIAGPFVGHTDWIDCIAFSPDGQRIVSSSRDRTVRVWDSYSGETVAGPFEGHTDRIKSVGFSPDGTRVASGSSDRTVCVWDSHDGRLLAGPFNGHRNDVSAVLFSVDGMRVYSGSDDGTICVWDARDGAAGGELALGHAGVIQCVPFSSDGTRAASGSADHTVCVWDTHSGTLVAGPLTGHAGNVLSVSFSSDGERIVSGSKDRTLRTWNASTGALLVGPFEGHTGYVWSVTFSPDGSRIASGSDDATIQLWDSTTGAPDAEPFRGHTSAILSIVFSLDGSRIVSGSIDSTVRMWDATSGNTIWASDAHTSWVLCVAFSPDGTRIVSGSYDCAVSVLDAGDGTVLHGPFAGPTKDVAPLVLSPDGETAAAISSDKMLHVWEPQSGKVIASPLQEYGGEVWSVALSPDDTRIIAGWANGMVRVWDVASTVQQSTSSFHDWSIDDDGWLIDSKSQRMVWVPSDLRLRILLPGATNQVVMGGSCTVRIDDELLLGDRWGKCYDVSRGPAS